MCIHETRKGDYATYATDVLGVDGEWQNQQLDGIPCGDKNDHPVVGMNWEDSQRFCAWLSKKEGETYRLPTDEEWSIAVGLGHKERRDKDTTPEMLSCKEMTEFPWGSNFPPKTKDRVGNYGDSAWHEKFPAKRFFIEGYTDGFPTTAPVMSFKPNKHGLYDLGGNVWEWVGDWWNISEKDKVLRGASFYGDGTEYSLSSFRLHYSPSRRTNGYGFRCVLEARTKDVSTSGTSSEFEPDKADADTAKKLTGTKWTWGAALTGSVSTIEFGNNRTCHVNNDPPHRWVRLESSVLKWDDGTLMTFSEDFETFEAKTPSGQRFGRRIVELK